MLSVKRKATITLAGISFAWFVFWVAQPLLNSDYNATEIEVPSDIDEVRPIDMNDQGHIVGHFQKKPTDKGIQGGAFVFRSGKFEELDIKRTETDREWHYSVSAINNNDLIVGTLKNSTKTGPTLTRAFSYKSDSRELSFFSWSADHYAIDVNDFGHVVAFGESDKPCEVFDMSTPIGEPLRTKDGNCKTPSLIVDRIKQIEKRINANYVRPTAINNSGQISFSKDGTFYSENAINNQGVVVGQWQSNGRYLAFMKKHEGAVLSLPTQTNESSAFSINDSDIVLGRQHDYYVVPLLPIPATQGGYFIYKDGEIRDLRLVSGIPRFKYDSIDFLKINNKGKILVQVRNGKNSKALVLTPKT